MLPYFKWAVPASQTWKMPSLSPWQQCSQDAVASAPPATYLQLAGFLSHKVMVNLK